MRRTGPAYVPELVVTVEEVDVPLPLALEVLGNGTKLSVWVAVAFPSVVSYVAVIFCWPVGMSNILMVRLNNARAAIG